MRIKLSIGLMAGMLFAAAFVWKPATRWILPDDQENFLQSSYVLMLDQWYHSVSVASGRHLLAAATEHEVVLLDVLTRREQARIRTDEPIEWVRFTNDGNGILMKTAASLSIWDSDSLRLIKSVRDPEIVSRAQSYGAPSNDRVLVVLSYASYHTVFDIMTERSVLVLPQKGGTIRLTDDGTKVLMLSPSTSEITIRDIRTGSEKTCGATGLGSYALASPDGRWTAWLDADHVYLLNWQDGTVRRLTSGHWDGPRHVFFSSDCSTIGIVGIAGIRFFDTATLRMRTTIDIGHAQIVSVHTDGRMLALAHRYERRVDIWTFNVSDEWTPM